MVSFDKLAERVGTGMTFNWGGDNFDVRVKWLGLNREWIALEFLGNPDKYSGEYERHWLAPNKTGGIRHTRGGVIDFNPMPKIVAAFLESLTEA